MDYYKLVSSVAVIAFLVVFYLWHYAGRTVVMRRHKVIHELVLWSLAIVIIVSHLYSTRDIEPESCEKVEYVIAK